MTTLTQAQRDELAALLEQAARLYTDGQWDEAIAAYNRAITLAPRLAPAYVERGLIRHELGRYEEALRDFETALALDPGYGRAYYGRGWARHVRGDFEGELDDARRGLELDPDHAEMYYRRMGAAYHGLQQHEPAIDTYTYVLSLYPDDEGTLLNRAACYLDMGQSTLALADLNRALALDPDWGWAFRLRGQVHMSMGEPTLALADFEEALRLLPGDGLSVALRGTAHKALGSKEKARADFSGVLSTSYERRARRLAEEELRRLGSVKGFGTLVLKGGYRFKTPWPVWARFFVQLIGGIAVAFLAFILVTIPPISERNVYTLTAPVQAYQVVASGDLEMRLAGYTNTFRVSADDLRYVTDIEALKAQLQAGQPVHVTLANATRDDLNAGREPRKAPVLGLRTDSQTFLPFEAIAADRGYERTVRMPIIMLAILACLAPIVYWSWRAGDYPVLWEDLQGYLTR